MTIAFPSNTATIINEIRHAIGRDVEFITVTPSGCSACTLDPVTNTSTNAFCVVCSGVHWIPQYSMTLISGHITWGQADILNWYTGGQAFDGDCRVQIEYTEDNLIVLDSTSWLQIDDHCLEIKKKTYRGVPELNRVLLDCIELENHVRLIDATDTAPMYLLLEDGTTLGI